MYRSHSSSRVHAGARAGLAEYQRYESLIALTEPLAALYEDLKHNVNLFSTTADNERILELGDDDGSTAVFRISKELSSVYSVLQKALSLPKDEKEAIRERSIENVLTVLRAAAKKAVTTESKVSISFIYLFYQLLDGTFSTYDQLKIGEQLKSSATATSPAEAFLQQRLSTLISNLLHLDALLKRLASNPNLQVHYHQLVQFIQREAIIELNLSSCDLTDKDVESVAALLLGSSLIRLNLANNAQVASTGVTALASTLQCAIAPDLQWLDISGIKLTIFNMQKLSTCLSREVSRVGYLGLSQIYHNTFEKQWKHPTRILSYATALPAETSSSSSTIAQQVLQLNDSNAEIGLRAQVEQDAIVSARSYLASVVTRLRGRGLGYSKEADGLHRLIDDNAEEFTLSLMCCELTSEDIKHIAVLLPYSQFTQVLLDGNEAIGDEGILALAKALPKAKKLLGLTLFGIPFIESTKVILKQAAIDSNIVFLTSDGLCLSGLDFVEARLSRVPVDADAIPSLGVISLFAEGCRVMAYKPKAVGESLDLEDALSVNADLSHSH